MKNNHLMRLIALILVVVLGIFSLAACGEVADEPQNPADNPEYTDDDGGACTDAGGAYVDYYFRNSKLLNQHYDKHGRDMGFPDAESYEKAASDVVNNPAALHKTEAEDGDDVYYVEATNEFVVVSQDGYIRTYFLPDAGIKYYNKQ